MNITQDKQLISSSVKHFVCFFLGGGQISALDPCNVVGPHDSDGVGVVGLHPLQRVQHCLYHNSLRHKPRQHSISEVYPLDLPSMRSQSLSYRYLLDILRITQHGYPLDITFVYFMDVHTIFICKMWSIYFFSSRFKSMSQAYPTEGLWTLSPFDLSTPPRVLRAD